MAKAVADPGELRRFAADLKKFNTEVQAQMGSLQARFGSLETTWRDQEHRRVRPDHQGPQEIPQGLRDTDPLPAAQGATP